MLEVLRFTFESFWHFVGVCFLIAWVFGLLAIVVDSIKVKMVHIHIPPKENKANDS